MREATESEIRERLIEAHKRLDTYEVALKRLLSELTEMRVALRSIDGAQAYPANVGGKGRTRKPPGIPPMTQLIVSVLLSRDGGPMEPREIVEEIRARWWPDAPVTSVGPIVWRMAKEGVLSKERQLYSISSDQQLQKSEN